MQSIPSKSELRSNKEDALIEEISSNKINEEAITLVKTLQHDIDIVTIAHLLASHIINKNVIKGKDNIGFGLQEAEKLLEKAGTQSRDRKGGYRGNNRNRSGNRNNSGRSRNRSSSRGR
jgi:ATP-dependent RNA helicase DeaD